MGVSTSIPHIAAPLFQGTCRTFSIYTPPRFRENSDVNRRFGSSGHSEDEVNFRTRNPPSSVVWVGNLPFGADKVEIEEIFRAFGELQEVRIGVNPDGTSRGFGHVQFKSQADAVRCVDEAQENPLYLRDRDLRLDYAKDLAKREPPPYHKLYVAQFNAEQDSLENIFQEFSSGIVSTHLLDDKKGSLYSAGFVDFNTVEQATAALAKLNDLELSSGTRLKVSYARAPRRPADQGDSYGMRDSRVRRDVGRQRYSGAGSEGGYGGDWRGGRKSSGFRRAEREN